MDNQQINNELLEAQKSSAILLRLTPIKGLFNPNKPLTSDLFINLDLIKKVTFSKFEAMHNRRTETLSDIDILQTITMDIDRTTVYQINLDEISLNFTQDVKYCYDRIVEMLNRLSTLTI